MISQFPNFTPPTPDDMHVFAGTVSFGSAMGFCSGYALKKIGRAAATTVGVIFLGLTSAQRSGYIDVRWEKIEADSMSLVSTTLCTLRARTQPPPCGTVAASRPRPSSIPKPPPCRRRAAVRTARDPPTGRGCAHPCAHRGSPTRDRVRDRPESRERERERADRDQERTTASRVRPPAPRA